MNTIIKKTNSFSNSTSPDLSSSHLPFSVDCSSFLNWNEQNNPSDSEKAAIFRSLVATVKSQPALDVSLEVKAVKFLESVHPKDEESAYAIVASSGLFPDEYSTNFIQCIVVLVSSASHAIIATTMEMLNRLILTSSVQVRLALVKANLIPQLVASLHPLSVSSPDYAHIHTGLIRSIINSFWLTTPDCLEQLGIEDSDEEQAVHEIVFQHVVAPSEKYIWHLCVNRYSIIDRRQSWNFMEMLARLLPRCSYHQPSMDCVFRLPVFLTIPSYLAFFEWNDLTEFFLFLLNNFQWNWNGPRREEQQMWKTVHQMLRMEGIEDVIEAKLRNIRKRSAGRPLVGAPTEWSNTLGMNLPLRR
ncbi:hypothetical protein BLNAU_5911 [Blattamonas nauphoetae]|uniref:Uncharacterized protein n=1 Tax=Blattamonas nauphoetae TaxID=2049346 RepID=A0ABQ9Y5V6_9EUKA|nr:hypothetical protein BLNAU_5911 [Blattamonas nauphoetae]